MCSGGGTGIRQRRRLLCSVWRYENRGSGHWAEWADMPVGLGKEFGLEMEKNWAAET
jgi:hypothetical protein